MSHSASGSYLREFYQFISRFDDGSSLILGFPYCSSGYGSKFVSFNSNVFVSHTNYTYYNSLTRSTVMSLLTIAQTSSTYTYNNNGVTLQLNTTRHINPKKNTKTDKSVVTQNNNTSRSIISNSCSPNRLTQPHKSWESQERGGRTTCYYRTTYT
eukprot:gene9848-6920_t